jgi:adenosylcobinamide-GDP ribazoletransferase
LKYIKRFALMIQFLTRIPLPVKLSPTVEDYGKGLVFAPEVGLIVGLVLAGAYYVLSFIFPAFMASVLVVITYIFLTGGLHLDGLGDTFDGLLSNRSREKVLEIMRDSRVGIHAVLAVVSLILINVGLISALDKSFAITVLVLAPAAGRVGPLIGSGISSYARSGEGLGKSFIDHCRVKDSIIGSIIYILVFLAIGGLNMLPLSFFSIITAFLLTKYFTAKIGGTTGDILGAICELNQTLFLAAAYLWRVIFAGL